VPPIESLSAAVNLSRARYLGHSHISLADVAGVLLIAVVPLLTGLPRLPLLPMLQVASPPALLLLGSALLAPRVVQGLHALVSRAGRSLGVATLMANRNLTRDLMRSAVTTGALILGMGMATSFAVFISSFVKSANTWVEQSIPADLFITSSAPGLVTHTPLPAALAEPIAAVAGVEAVERVRMADLAYQNTTVKLLANDARVYSAHAKMIMVQGEQAEAMREVSTGEATIVNESFANHFGLWRGDQVSLRTQHGTIALQIAGVNVDYLSDRGVVMIDRALYVQHWDDGSVDMFKVHTRPNTELEPLRRALAQQFGERYDLLVLTGREFATKLTSQIDAVFTIMRALQAVALVIAIMGVINALSANVHDRTREIGILRAVGMVRSQVRHVIMIEATMIGLCGATIGAIVGIGAGRLILSSAAVAVVGWSIPLAPDWWLVVQMTLILIVASAVAGWFPARNAARLSIPDAVAHR
jgi:putative ABC transport system permease protein